MLLGKMLVLIILDFYMKLCIEVSDVRSLSIIDIKDILHFV